jgi:hypothetical protein
VTPVTTAPPALPVFDAFPYLLTRVVPTLYHVLLVPEGVARGAAAAAAREQVAANRLPTCLAFRPDEALYLEADGARAWTDAPPRGGILVAGKLRPCAALAPAAGEAARVARLEAYVAAQRRGGYLLGDVRKGGRPAGAAEAARLEGRGPGGVPRGMVRCGACGEWAGQCLDPSPVLRGLVVRARCRCENDTRCAGCGRPLFERQVDANYYELADGQVWHVPGFCGLDHRCG